MGLRFQISPFSFSRQTLSEQKCFIPQPANLSSGIIRTCWQTRPFMICTAVPVRSHRCSLRSAKSCGRGDHRGSGRGRKENAALNHLDNCEFLAGDVLKVLDTIEERPDYIVLDPPRDGIHPKALEKIINYGVDHMIYISCKPTSLARDLEVLLARGYVVDKVQCVDMFPNTVHVETVVLLTRVN